MKHFERISVFFAITLVILHCVSSVQGAAPWQIVSTEPQDKQVKGYKDESMRMVVTANNYIRRCTWMHESGGTKKSCEFRYNKNTKKLEKQSECQLDEHEGRVHLAGNYNNHECGIRISDAILSDSGEWKVEAKEFIDKNPISFVFGSNPAHDSRTFNVSVTEKPDHNVVSNLQSTLPPLLHIEGGQADVVLGSRVIGAEEDQNGDSNTSTSMAIVGGVCGLLALIAVLAFAGYRYKKLLKASRNESIRFNDVRDDDDDKTWRGDEAWRKKTDGNHYSEPPTNGDGYDRPCLDNEVNIAIPQNEKALEKMGEPLTIAYGGSRRVL